MGWGLGFSKQAGLSTKDKAYPEPQEPFAYAVYVKTTNPSFPLTASLAVYRKGSAALSTGF